jgi:hypothetical protein
MKPHVIAAAVLLTLAACGSASEAASATPEIVIEGAAPSTTVASETAEETGAVEATQADPEVDDSILAESEPVSTTDEEKVLAFADCMRNEGVDFDDPTVDAQGAIVPPDNIDEISATPEFGAASEVCQPLLDGASFLPSQDQMVDLQDQLLDVAECLRGYGIDVDDPDIIGNPPTGPGANIFPGFDPLDPANADAVAECSQLVNAPGGQ